MFKSIQKSVSVFWRKLSGTAVTITAQLKVNGFNGPNVPKEMYAELDAAGVSFCAMGQDGFPIDAQNVAQTSILNHAVVYRSTSNDVPDYTLSPKDAAINHWAWHKPKIPPEINKSVTWIMTINEPRKEIEWSDWLGHFETEMSMLANADGYKYLAFGFASGTPDLGAWETEGMIRYLNYSAANHDKAAVGLHEYSYSLTSIWTKSVEGVGIIDTTKDDPDAGYLIGRFTKLFAACDQLGIKRPYVIITEWGWLEDNVPSPDVAMQHIYEVGELYAQYPELLGAAIWYLGSGYGGIAEKAKLLIDPLKNLLLTTTYEVTPPDPPTPDPECEGLPREDYTRVVNVLHPDTTPERATAIFNERWGAHRETVTGSYDDAGIGALTNKTAVLWDMPEADKQTFIDWFAEHYPGTIVIFEGESEPPIEPGDPRVGLTIAPPFSDYFVLTSAFNVPRDYDGDGTYDDKHEGADYDIVGEPTDSKKPVLCGFPGVVTWAGTKGTDYGNYVIVQCQNNNGVFYLWYCHMDSVYVAVGQTVNVGTPLGELGGTGGNWSEHVHVNLQVPGFGLSGYVVSDVVDPAPFVQMNPTNPNPDPEYTGPPIEGEFVRGVDNPASDWYWPTAKAVFDVTGLACKFHTSGDNHTWFDAYKHPTFNMARNNSDDILGTSFNGINNFYSRGLRDLEGWNEPNLAGEGLGSKWADGADFGAKFKTFCQNIKVQFPEMRVWFPGCSPQFGAQFAFIDAAKAAGGFDLIYGMCCHAYTEIHNDAEMAAQALFDEVMLFRSKYAMTCPLIASEFSCKPPEGINVTAAYKAEVYHRLFDKLALVEGVQMAVSFTSSWHPSLDERHEGWLELGIHSEW